MRRAALARARRDLAAGTEIPIWSAICLVECPFICPSSITERSEVGSSPMARFRCLDRSRTR